MNMDRTNQTDPDFWTQYPGDRAEFSDLVRKGLHYEISLDSFTERRVISLQRVYGGLSVGFLKFIYGEWRFNAAYCEAKYGPHVSSALAEYHKSLTEQQAAKDLAVKEYQERLALGPPTPPKGFYWCEDNSCVRLPELHCFTLRSNSLDYPKGGG